MLKRRLTQRRAVPATRPLSQSPPDLLLQMRRQGRRRARNRPAQFNPRCQQLRPMANDAVSRGRTQVRKWNTRHEPSSYLRKEKPGHRPDVQTRRHYRGPDADRDHRQTERRHDCSVVVGESIPTAAISWFQHSRCSAGHPSGARDGLSQGFSRGHRRQSPDSSASVIVSCDGVRSSHRPHPRVRDATQR